MYIHSSHSIEYGVASVESKRRAGLSIIRSCQWCWLSTTSLLKKNKMHATSCPTSIKNGVVLSSERHSPHNHDHFLLCLATLSLVKLPLRAEPPPPVTPCGGPITAPGGLSPAAETGGAIWPTVALPKQTHTQTSHISVKPIKPRHDHGRVVQKQNARGFLILEAGTTASVLTWSACP